MSDTKMLYAKVILPLRIRGDISYLIPDELRGIVFPGLKVRVNFANREYIAVVFCLSDNLGGFSGKVKEILAIDPSPPLLTTELEFWQWISSYYMCSIGEVYKAACPGNTVSVRKKERKPVDKVKDNNDPLPTLSDSQSVAYKFIEDAFSKNKVALLNGITGSGKTEIYTQLASEYLKNGQSVLYMVPEIALSRQLSSRLEKVFGHKLLIYHSKQSMGERARIHGLIRKADVPYIVLGLRSSIFLPFVNLGLIIVDEEHDSSYKQTDPAPRYNGRDSAVMLAGIHSSHILLGTATPSLESLYNAYSNRYVLVELNEKYFGAESPEIELIDTIRETKRGKMVGLFSAGLLKNIGETIAAGEQVLIFRNRRSYSPVVQCLYCGDIPKCAHCNVSLSYHKSRDELRCHYCDYHVKYNTICSKCGKPGLRDRGAGTEKIEEKIKEFFPDARVERFDFETTQSKLRERKILKDFSQHKLDILVGTQMISKGFDFEHLSLICLLQADSMLAIQDFRANEKALQLLTQLSGRSGRKFKKGKILIQTAQPEHPVYKSFEDGAQAMTDMLKERKEFDYPPFVRLVKITARCHDRDKLNIAANEIEKRLPQWGIREFSGPFSPNIDRMKGEYAIQFLLKLSRTNNIQSIKKNVADGIDNLILNNFSSVKVSIDADPL